LNGSPWDNTCIMSMSRSCRTFYLVVGFKGPVV
jgi:hypothetical protein